MLPIGTSANMPVAPAAALAGAALGPQQEHRHLAACDDVVGTEAARARRATAGDAGIGEGLIHPANV